MRIDASLLAVQRWPGCTRDDRSMASWAPAADDPAIAKSTLNHSRIEPQAIMASPVVYRLFHPHLYRLIEDAPWRTGAYPDAAMCPAAAADSTGYSGRAGCDGRTGSATLVHKSFCSIP